MTGQVPSIVVRSHNDMPFAGETADFLSTLSGPFEMILFDNGSVDGSREVLAKLASRVVDVPDGEYLPGRVLNQAMELAGGEIVVFLNADCTPQRADWLDQLMTGIRRPGVAAVFGRQIPRPGCDALFSKDTNDTFGDGRRQAKWRHCFSMASSAVRKSVWREFPFSEGISYSEDIAWTWEARQRGYRVDYIPESIAMHSHNYTLAQWYRRQFGEGKAEAHIFEWTRWRRSVMRSAVLPFLAQVRSDWRYCRRTGTLGQVVRSPVLRMVQNAGRYRGLRAGLAEAGR